MRTETENLARPGVRLYYDEMRAIVIMQRSNYIYKHHILPATIAPANQGPVLKVRRERDQSEPSISLLSPDPAHS